MRVGGEMETLVHSFWTYDEIVRGKTVCDDWDVPEGLIPFYGDWHTLLCLDAATGAVVYLDDDRNELARWTTTTRFLSSLKTVDEPALDDSLLDAVEFTLDPKLVPK
ncbi:MAG: hypothetical protein AMXMBFR22_32920 [Phycisphaerae bacterium]